MQTRLEAGHRRRGLTLTETVVVILSLLSLLYFLALVLSPQLGPHRETARGNTCRNNMRALATALFNHHVRHGHYPGYMNALQRTDKKLYVDPVSQKPIPVSWAVMILPDIDRIPLFELWRKPQDGLGPDEQPQNPRIYIEQFLCPSDPQANQFGTLLSFVVNAGQPDAPVLPGGSPATAIPRDWRANGMFFDNYSEHPLVRKSIEPQRPMIYMRDELVVDPKSRTILLTENLDATSYTFDFSQSADGWQAAEIQAGSIWRLEAVDESTKPPTMKPPVPSLGINVDMGKGDGKSYNYCRPSSRHPQSVNVAFVEVNVAPLRDTISYYVYAKLMASDDEHVAPAGQRRDESAAGPYRGFRGYKLSEEEINP